MSQYVVREKDESVGDEISSAITENAILFGTIAALYVIIIGSLIVLVVFIRKQKSAKQENILKRKRDAKKMHQAETEAVQKMNTRKVTMPDESDVGTTQVKSEEAEQLSNNGQPMQHALSQYNGQVPNKSKIEMRMTNSLTSGESTASSTYDPSSCVAPSFVTSLEPRTMPKMYFLTSHPDQFRSVSPILSTRRRRSDLRAVGPKSTFGSKFVLTRKYTSSSSSGIQASSGLPSVTSALSSAESSRVRSIKSKEQLLSTVQSCTRAASSAASKHSTGME